LETWILALVMTVLFFALLVTGEAAYKSFKASREDHLGKEKEAAVGEAIQWLKTQERSRRR
jgi:hypothetical protein